VRPARPIVDYFMVGCPTLGKSFRGWVYLFLGNACQIMLTESNIRLFHPLQINDAMHDLYGKPTTSEYDAHEAITHSNLEWNVR
jgi:hypothetical protein